MGERTVRFSDLSGQMADAAELASVIVTEHPELEQPVRLEAMPAELEPLKKLAIRAVALEVRFPGDEEEPTRYVVTENNFAKLATDRPMAEVLASAEPVVAKATRRSHNRTADGEPLRTFNTLENAGMPHQGKVSAEEARLVRDNLEAVNASRAAQDLPPIDPANPIDAKRYGFGQADTADA
jgi:hypothetical protein